MTFFEEVARLRRIGGKLSFNDELIPVNTELTVVHLDGARASVVLARPLILVPVYAADLNTDNFEFIRPVTDEMAARGLSMFRKREHIVGNQLTVGVGSLLYRTGQPFISTCSNVLPGHTKVVGDNDGRWILEDTAVGSVSHVPRRYMTDAYFEPVSS